MQPNLEVIYDLGNAKQFKKKLTASTFHQVIFKTKTKIIGLAIIKTKVKQELKVFAFIG